MALDLDLDPAALETIPSWWQRPEAESFLLMPWRKQFAHGEPCISPPDPAGCVDSVAGSGPPRRGVTGAGKVPSVVLGVSASASTVPCSSESSEEGSAVRFSSKSKKQFLSTVSDMCVVMYRSDLHAHNMPGMC